MDNEQELNFPPKIGSLLDGKARQDIASEVPIMDIRTGEDFEQRLEHLRNSIQYSSAGRARVLAARIRQSSWVLALILFPAILIIWDIQDSKPAGAFLIALLPSAVVACLAELAIAVLRRRT